MQFATRCALIERLNIFEDVSKTVAFLVDLVFRHCVEHEGVIRIRRMAEGEGCRFPVGH